MTVHSLLSIYYVISSTEMYSPKLCCKMEKEELGSMVPSVGEDSHGSY